MRKKLIEVALPLDAINREAARENYIYRGNPSALHKWWAQRPFAVARTVLFASLIDDPSSTPDLFPTTESQDAERMRLFAIIERLARWESMTDPAVIAEAQHEINRAVGIDRPAVFDPFSGGATIPLEAQRLGLAAYAADLNPVAALIARALLEFPRQFRNRPPVGPSTSETLRGDSEWPGVQGVQEDIRRYGQWMLARAHEQLIALYPEAKCPDGELAPVIAWLWARTTRCPNPACGAETPLVRSFAVSTKKGGETWVEPVIDRVTRSFAFEVRTGKPTIGGTVGSKGARCVVCGESVPLAHIRGEALSAQLKTRLMATVIDGPKGRAYLSPSGDQESVAASAAPSDDLLRLELPINPRAITVRNYGMTEHRDLYTKRQLLLLSTLSDLVREGAAMAERDSNDAAYGRAIGTYLAFVVDKVAQFNSSLVPWYPKENRQTSAFGRQALTMIWDFAEGNPFAGIGGGIDVAIRTVADAVVGAAPDGGVAHVALGDATQARIDASGPVLVSTDPPYYDNVPYADLSDYFYVWLRRSAGWLHPDLFQTLLVPKTHELVAEPARFEGDRLKARAFFESGIKAVFERLRAIAATEFPLTVYYAFKQAETSNEGATVSTGWETMLTGLVDAGFSITGTWPTRTERTGRLRDTGSNALASSIVLVCRPRPRDAPLATRKEFREALRRELPSALLALQHGNVAPVDLAQASIGPGMGVFSRFSRVVDADGTTMTVHSALALINQVVDEQLAEQEGDFDADTRWAVSWFEQFGMNPGPFGVAETLSKAKNTAVRGLVEAGILESRAGKVRLLDRSEMADDWVPTEDERLTVWEAVQHLIATLDRAGEKEAARLVATLGGVGDAARELAYRLYVVCERKGWPQEAMAYNALVVAWPELTRLATTTPAPAEPAQATLDI